MRRIRKTLPIGCHLMLAFFVTACSRAESPYDRLCRIYEEASKQPMSEEVAALPFTRAKAEIPELGDDLAALAQVSLSERYELLRSMAREKGHQPDWRCEAIRTWNPPH